MIGKHKSGFKTSMAIGFSYIALLSSPKMSNAQWIYYPPRGWGYYRPPTVWRYRTYVGRVPVGTGIDFGRMGYNRFPGAWDYNGSISEIEGKRIIHNYFKRKEIGFIEDMSPRIRDTEIPYLRPDFRFDFQLINGVIIEYYSPGDKLDSEDREREFERRKDAINIELNRILGPLRWDWTLTERRREEIREALTFRYLNQLGVRYETDPNSERGFTITKPINFFSKKEIYEELGVKVEYIDAKKDAASIEQALEEILKDTTRGRILSEKKAEDVISKYLSLKRISHKRNTIFKTDSIRIRPDFLIEDKSTKNKLPTAIEYWSLTDKKYRKRRERIFEKYRKAGGKFYPIEASYNEEEILSKLEDTLFPKSEDEISPESENTTPPNSKHENKSTLIEK